jgi:two-component system nitrate/nitrite response regulator NarL
MATKKIILTDDHPLLLDGLTAIISEQQDLEVCATAVNGKQLLQIIPIHNPDLIVLDINLPEIDGIEAAKIIKNSNPEIKILCISTYYSKNLVDTLKAIPVEGFIPKQSDSKVVIKTINQILNGENIWLKSITEIVYQKEAPKELNILTQREKEVLRLIKKGMSTKDIAAALYLSVYTIDTHRKNICTKLNLASPGALSRYVSEKDF